MIPCGRTGSPRLAGRIGSTHRPDHPPIGGARGADAMTAVQTQIATPHPIYLAGRWVDSPDVLVVDNPARPGEPVGATYLATPEQYEEAVEAAVRAFEHTRVLPAFERGRAL